MNGVNKVTLLGNLGGDPEVRFTPGGAAVANATLATNKVWTKDGERKESTEWHRLVFWSRLAEIAGEYLRKGSTIYVEGELQTRKWDDKDGQTRYTTEIVVREMQMLGGRAEGGANNASGFNTDAGAAIAHGDTSPEDDDLF